MSDKKQRIRNIAKRLIDQHKNLRLAQQDYERMSRLIYTLPDPLNKYPWARLDMSTAPYNALRGGKAALSNLDEKVTVAPISISTDDETLGAKERANQWEYTLSHVLGRTAKRRANFRGSVIWDALVYDEICAQVVHLPTMFRIAGPESNVRKKAALRHGDWAIRLVNPQKLYVEYSDFMVERVLQLQLKTAQEIVDYWGDAAKTIRNRIKRKEEHAKMNYFEFDYVDYENRFVWVVEAKPGQSIPLEDKGITILKPEPWLTDEDGKPVPFLPWVCVAGGTQTEDLPEYQRKPMMFAIRQTEMWANDNIMRTLNMSQAIAEAGTPRDIFGGPSSEDIEIDYGEPGARIDLGPMQEYERIQRLGLDPSFSEYTDRLEAEIKRATVAEVLITGAPVGEIAAGYAYHLEIQTALASLGPWKNLGERFYERLHETILLMAHYRAEDIVAHDTKAKEYIIRWNDINPDRIEVKVELQPEVPVDKVQKIQAAIAMSQNLETPTRRILEWMGETDPEGLQKEYWKEQLNRAEMMGRLERIRRMASGELEQMAAEMAQGMIQQQMQQQQQAPQGENLMGPQGIEGVEGEAWNPAMGMPPPATASPMGNTREFQTGLTRAGTRIAGE